MNFNVWYKENYNEIIKSNIPDSLKTEIKKFGRNAWHAAITSTSQPPNEVDTIDTKPEDCDSCEGWETAGYSFCADCGRALRE